MEKKLLGFVFAVLILLPVYANATTMDFYTDGTITDGNDYYQVNVWDNATVNMTGGRVSYFYAYQISTVNFSDGTILGFHALGSSILNMSGGVMDYSLNVSGSSVANLTGGQIGNYIAIFDSAVVHIFGYGFNYTRAGGISESGWLSGFWANETPFTIYFRNLPESFPGTHVILHEIPEPASFVLFAIVGISILKRIH